MPYFDDIAGQAVSDGFATSGGMLLGRKMYDIFAAFGRTNLTTTAPSRLRDVAFALTSSTGVLLLIYQPAE